MRFSGALVVVFVEFEVGQALIPAPLRVVGDGRPLVVIARLAAHVNHAVDAAATPQHFATGVSQRSAVQTCGRFCFVQPIGAWIANAIQITNRDVYPVVIVSLAGLNQQNTFAGIGR